MLKFVGKLLDAFHKFPQVLFVFFNCVAPFCSATLTDEFATQCPKCVNGITVWKTKKNACWIALEKNVAVNVAKSGYNILLLCNMYEQA